MKVLNKEELQKAEEELRHHFPQSLQVYGFIFVMNRVETEPTDVLVDQWPDFSVLIIKPKRLKKPHFAKKICIYSTDESQIRNMLIRMDILDWTQYFRLSIDLLHLDMLKALTEEQGVQIKEIMRCHILSLPDPSTLTLDRLSFQVSSVQESYAALINRSWTFGKGEFTEPFVRSMIRDFPSCCVLDSEGQPVSWILTYASCAMGMLYTLPEHRRKGYAKALVITLAKKLHSQGFPVFCLISEDNQASYRLFTSLGFTGDPEYRELCWIMKVLNKEELQKAEEELRRHFPQSQQVYGFIFVINRVETEPTDVLVDQWPDFSVLIIKPKRLKKPDWAKKISIYSTDESQIRNMLIRTDILDWTQYFRLSIDLLHLDMLKALTEEQGVQTKEGMRCRVVSLQDPSTLTLDRLSFQVSSVQESYAALINSHWAFCKGEFTEPFVRSLIRDFPSCCVLDSEGQPVSWILTYASCAMGMLYTLPEHRRKGYTKALVITLAKKLHSQGFPVFCLIDEDSQLSYRLFTSLGFTGDPDYRITSLASLNCL